MYCSLRRVGPGREIRRPPDPASKRRRPPNMAVHANLRASAQMSPPARCQQSPPGRRPVCPFVPENYQRQDVRRPRSPRQKPMQRRMPALAPGAIVPRWQQRTPLPRKPPDDPTRGTGPGNAALVCPFLAKTRQSRRPTPQLLQEQRNSPFACAISIPVGLPWPPTHRSRRGLSESFAAVVDPTLK